MARSAFKICCFGSVLIVTDLFVKDLVYGRAMVTGEGSLGPSSSSQGWGWERI
jgi:hypothetical protein